MKVDVYPNITNVEVYENPISVPVEATWEKVTFSVGDPVPNTFDLGRAVVTDRDGDYVLQVALNGVSAEYGDDFTFDGTVITWVSPIALEVGEELVVWYSPKSAYGSVPGSGEVTTLTHLNDVTIQGPQAGQLLMRDSNGDFVNRFLSAGDNVSVVSSGTAVTLSANPTLEMSLLTSSVTASAQRSYLMDTTNSALIVTLPPTPSLGDTIQVSCFGGEALTILRNGKLINGLASNLTLANLQSVTLRYANQSIGWFQVK